MPFLLELPSLSLAYIQKFTVTIINTFPIPDLWHDSWT